MFLTQQATTGSAEFHRLLGLDPPTVEELTLALVVDQLTRAGFAIEGTGEGVATTTFSDIGALAWYLSNVPWAVPGFSIPRCRDALIRLHGHPIRGPVDAFLGAGSGSGADTASDAGGRVGAPRTGGTRAPTRPLHRA